MRDQLESGAQSDRQQVAAPFASYGACDTAKTAAKTDAKTGAECECQCERQSALQRLGARVPGLGIMFALCASCFLGSAGMLVKLTRSVHGIQVAVLRALIQLAIYGAVMCARGLSPLPARGERGAVLARALLGGTSITLSYYALKLIPLGDATTIRFSLPIWTLIVGYFLLGESCSPLKLAAVLTSVGGVLLIAKPDECLRLFAGAQPELEPEPAEAAGAQLGGCLLALGSSVCLALSLVAMRLSQRTPAELIICWLSLSSALMGTATLLALGEWSLPDNWRDVGLILANGLCGSAGQWFITSALKLEQSGVVSLARTFDIEVAFLYSALLLRERIRATSVAGALLVSASVIAVVLPKWLGSRKDQRPAAACAACRKRRAAA